MTKSIRQTRRIGHWISGRETPGTSGRTALVYNPAAGVVSAEVDMAAGSEIVGAVATAVAAAKDWRHASLSKRSGVLFAVIQGDKEAVDALLAHPDIAAVSFVGSTPIAKYIYETGTANGKRVQALGLS